MVKVIIQVPCFNEEKALPIALAELPRSLPGVSSVEWLIIDDGSTDQTVNVASKCGVDHIVRLHHNQGLAKAFMAGLDACLRLGADIIVNTDADNQYCAADIPKLLDPILTGKADIVIGDRQVRDIAHFSPLKKLLQWFGSLIVRRLSDTNIPDAPSGFRAIHRRAAEQLNVFNQYTYTLETIIQAGRKNMAITSVPVRTNAELRPSRLVTSIGKYVFRNSLILIRIFITYKPLRFFAIFGFLIMLPGFLLGMRYLYLLSVGAGEGNVQSLILASILLMSGFFVVMSGLLADLISVNRILLEELRTRTMRIEHSIASVTCSPETPPEMR